MCVAFHVFSCNNNTMHLQWVGRQRSECKRKKFITWFFEITQRINKWFYHTPNFSVLQFQQPCVSETRYHVSPYCTSLNFLLAVTSSLTSPFLQNIFPHLSFLRTRKRWKSKGTEYGLRVGWGRIVHLSFVIASCVFRLVCSLYCCVEMAFSNISVKSNTTEQLLHGISVISGILTSVIIYVNVDYAREVV